MLTGDVCKALERPDGMQPRSNTNNQLSHTEATFCMCCISYNMVLNVQEFMYSTLWTLLVMINLRILVAEVATVADEILEWECLEGPEACDCGPATSSGLMHSQQ